MRKLATFLVLLSLAMFTIGCTKKTTDTPTDDGGNNVQNTDNGGGNGADADADANK